MKGVFVVRNRNKRATVAKTNVAIQSPWVTAYNQIKSLFERDPELLISSMVENDGTYEFTISSSNRVKIEAIQSLLKEEYVFGNVTMKVNFSVENEDILQVVKNAFLGNDILKDTQVGGNPLTGEQNFALFKKEVIQFYNDNLLDYYGNKSTLAEDIAREVFNERVLKEVHFCTDIRDINEF